MTEVVLGLYIKCDTNAGPAQHLAALHLQASAIGRTHQDIWLPSALCDFVLLTAVPPKWNTGLETRQMGSRLHLQDPGREGDLGRVAHVAPAGVEAEHGLDLQAHRLGQLKDLAVA